MSSDYVVASNPQELERLGQYFDSIGCRWSSRSSPRDMHWEVGRRFAKDSISCGDQLLHGGTTSHFSTYQSVPDQSVPDFLSEVGYRGHSSTGIAEGDRIIVISDGFLKGRIGQEGVVISHAAGSSVPYHVQCDNGECYWADAKQVASCASVERLRHDLAYAHSSGTVSTPCTPKDRLKASLHSLEIED